MLTERALYMSSCTCWKQVLCAPVAAGLGVDTLCFGGVPWCLERVAHLEVRDPSLYMGRMFHPGACPTFEAVFTGGMFLSSSGEACAVISTGPAGPLAIPPLPCAPRLLENFLSRNQLSTWWSPA